jgi:hypothetical protein
MDLKITAEWVPDPYAVTPDTLGYGTIEVKLGGRIIHTIDRYWTDAPKDEDLVEIVGEWFAERLEKKEFRI